MNLEKFSKISNPIDRKLSKQCAFASYQLNKNVKQTGADIIGNKILMSNNFCSRLDKIYYGVLFIDYVKDAIIGCGASD